MDRPRPLQSVGYLASEHVLFQGEVRVSQSTLWLIAVLLAAMALVPSVEGAFPGEQEGPNDVPPMSRVSPSDSPAPGGLPPATKPSAVVGVGSDLVDLVMDPNRPYVYTADRLRDQVLVVSLATASVERTLPVGNSPIALALNPAATRLYVGHSEERTIRVFDLASWTQVGNLTIPFLTRDLAAPTDTELVATTHDAGFAGEYPYVISATDGSVLQRLDPGELVYMDFLVALNSARTWAYLVPSAAAPFLMYSFERDPQGTWTFRGRGPDFGSGTPAARDIVVSPDDRWIYVTLAGGTLEGIAVDRTGSGPVGLGSASYGADVGPTSQFAASGGAAEVRIFDVSGTSDPGGFSGFPVDPAAVLGLTGHAWGLRISPSGDGIAVIVGLADDAWQDLEIVDVPPLTRVRPVAPTERFVNRSVFDVVGRVIDFRTMTGLSATVSMNGVSAPASFDPGTGRVLAHVGPVAEGDYETRISAFRGTEVAVAVWTITVDTTPPDFRLDPVPSVVESDVLDLTGTVIDSHLFWVRVGSSYPIVTSEGHFSVYVPLMVGMNRIEMEAADQAGNIAQAAVTTEFRPPARWFTHATSHFRIQVPFGWSAAGNVSRNGVLEDVVLTSTDGLTDLGVISVYRITDGTEWDARTVLDDELSALGQLGRVVPLGPEVTWTSNGHARSRVLIAFDPGRPEDPQSQRVFVLVGVVLGAEWGKYWLLVGRLPRGDYRGAAAQVNASIDSLEALPAPLTGYLLVSIPWIVRGGIVAISIEAIVIAYLVLRGSRKQRRRFGP